MSASKPAKTASTAEREMIRQIRYVLKHGDSIAIKGLTAYLSHLCARAKAGVR